MGLLPILYSVAQDTTPKTLSGSCALPLLEKSLSLPLSEYGAFLSQSCPNDDHSSLKRAVAKITNSELMINPWVANGFDDTVALTEKKKRITFSLVANISHEFLCRADRTETFFCKQLTSMGERAGFFLRESKSLPPSLPPTENNLLVGLGLDLC